MLTYYHSNSITWKACQQFDIRSQQPTRSRPRYRAERRTIVALSTSHTRRPCVTCSLSIILENAARIGRKSGKTITEVTRRALYRARIRASDNSRRGRTMANTSIRVDVSHIPSHLLRKVIYFGLWKREKHRKELLLRQRIRLKEDVR